MPKKSEEEEGNEFEEDFEEDFEESKPSKLKRKEPEKIQFEEEDSEDSDDEEDDYEEEKEKRAETRGRPKGSFKKPESNDNYLKPKTKSPPSTKYEAYHISERVGVKDAEENKSVGDDIYSLLARILNDLNDIKLAVGA